MTSSPHGQHRASFHRSLRAEVLTILAAAGLPQSHAPDRASAHGLVVAESGDSVEVEWFVSRTLRRVAADEQLRAMPAEAAALAQESARRHIHLAIFGILSEVGYEVQSAQSAHPGALRVRRAGTKHAAHLARELRSTVAEVD